MLIATIKPFHSTSHMQTNDSSILPMELQNLLSTGWYGLAILLSKMPWNRIDGQTCCSSGNCSTSN